MTAVGQNQEVYPWDDDLLQTQEAVRTCWETAIGMIVRGGPFTGKDKMQKVPELVDTACRLLPNAFPKSGHRWSKSAIAEPEDYANLPINCSPRRWNVRYPQDGIRWENLPLIYTCATVFH